MLDKEVEMTKTQKQAIEALRAKIAGQREEGIRKGFDFTKPSFFTKVLAQREAALARMEQEYK
jgi:hypothetical protein